MRNILPDNEMRALSLAMAGGAAVAVATMLVPAGAFEAVAGSTGISEMVGVAKPPLGDTARALIAFCTGALTLAALVFFLLRPREQVVEAAGGEDEADEPSALRGLFAKIAMPKMPWNKGESDITELADLPKLKNGDSHPDAPPRHPLRARELSDAEQAEDWNGDRTAAPAMAVPDAGTDDQASTPVTAAPEEEPMAETIAQAAPEAEPVRAADFRPSLADMVAQLEAAVAERKRQLADLEVVAAQLGAGRSAVRQAAGPAGLRQSDEDFVAQRSPVAPEDDGMDDALSSALATLHRINEGAR